MRNDQEFQVETKERKKNNQNHFSYSREKKRRRRKENNCYRQTISSLSLRIIISFQS